MNLLLKMKTDVALELPCGKTIFYTNMSMIPNIGEHGTFDR